MNKKGQSSTIKIACVCLLLIFCFAIGYTFVTADNTAINTVKIVLADDYEISVLTTKTKVSEILAENHIIILPDEKVIPSADEEIKNDKIITLSKITASEEIIQIAEQSNDIPLEKLLESYSCIKEKIEIQRVPIPYETVTKDVSNGAADTTNKVLQQGKDGVREVTYRIRYQNDIELEKVEINSVIISEPVEKIIQVQVKTTSRSGERVATTNPAESAYTELATKVAGITPVVKTMNSSAYTASTCGKSPDSAGYGRTASGAMASAYYTIAAGSGYKMGTVVYIPYFANSSNGGWFVVQDRGGAISNNHIDIYFDTYNECIQFGRRNLECYIYEF